MKRISSIVATLAVAMIVAGCDSGSAPTPSTKSTPTEGMGRPRPDADGKMQKSDAPKGAQKPVAD